MKRTAFALLALVALACVCPAFAGEVPPITAAEFGGSAKEAHWLWSLLINDQIAQIILWALEGGVAVLIGMLGLKGSKIARCVLFIAAGVRETFIAFVRPAKLAAKDGKLTEDDRAESMRQALERAKAFAAAEGLGLFKYLSKDVAAAVAELCVRLFKGNSKKATALLPLPDLSPSAPRV